MQTVLRATEQERVRLAADLHDGPVQELTALRYGLTRARNRIQRGQADQAEGLLAELEDELAAGITGLRRLMAELRPAVLDEQRLEVAMHKQVRAFEATSGVACAISTGLQGRLAPDLETVLYRVTQETSTTWASTPASPGSPSRWRPRTARCTCASTTTGPASTRPWPPASSSMWGGARSPHGLPKSAPVPWSG
jgi:hypothetical protein